MHLQSGILRRKLCIRLPQFLKGYGVAALFGVSVLPCCDQLRAQRSDLLKEFVCGGVLVERKFLPVLKYIVWNVCM
jgi:hypothetical protein